MGLTITELVRLVVDDWKFQVKEMTDEKLLEDRSHWMKNYGYEFGDDYDENTLDYDVHTIAIELEQMRRFGEIIYKMKDGNLKYKKNKDTLTEKE
mgnify:FL=1|tara:strand:+ start:18051 stop:18335 length:285 start_codon:yes stop_codon:yes gene_type:complete